MRSSTLAKLAAFIVAAGAMYYLTARGTPPPTSASATAAPPPVPVPANQQEPLTMFVKFKACEPTNCDQVACDKFSDGQSADGVAHLATCRWTDRSRGESPRRCAYAHYVEQPGKPTLGALFLSTPSAGEVCERDQAFNDLLKNDVGYTGRLP